MEESSKLDKFTTEHKMYVDRTDRNRLIIMFGLIFIVFFFFKENDSNENIHDLIKQDLTQKMRVFFIITRN